MVLHIVTFKVGSSFNLYRDWIIFLKVRCYSYEVQDVLYCFYLNLSSDLTFHKLRLDVCIFLKYDLSQKHHFISSLNVLKNKLIKLINIINKLIG